MAPGHQPISQPSLRDEIIGLAFIGLAFIPGVETPGYLRWSLRDRGLKPRGDARALSLIKVRLRSKLLASSASLKICCPRPLAHTKVKARWGAPRGPQTCCWQVAALCCHWSASPDHSPLAPSRKISGPWGLAPHKSPGQVLGPTLSQAKRSPRLHAFRRPNHWRCLGQQEATTQVIAVVVDTRPIVFCLPDE